LVSMPPELEVIGEGPLRRLPHPPDLGECQVFRGGASSWLPFLHPCLAGSIELGWQDRANYESLAGYYEGLRPSPREEPIAEEEGDWQAERESSLSRLGEDVARYFNLPGNRRQSALHMLLGLSPVSRRE